MTLRDLPVRLVVRLRHPQTTVRWRLTLIYSGLFLACGAALLAITYTLVEHAPGTAAGQVWADIAGPDQLQTAPAPRATGRSFSGTVSSQARATQEALPPGVQHVLRSSAGKAAVRYVGAQQRISDLHQLEIESGIALAIMAIISGGLGWLVAGRVLRPLRTITAAAQEISETSLHRRLALTGPRDELRQLADTIDGLLGRLEGAFDAQRRFVANASHELRTPLTAARALLEMVITDPHATVETFKETCQDVLNENEQQEQLIDALLALAQGQRGIDKRQPVDLAAVAREVLKAHELDVAANGLRLDASLKPAILCGDQRLIERLITNLVENAIRHNTPGGHVHALVEERSGATLTIANTGPLVPAKEVDRLLQPFQRLAPDRVGHRNGVGLGLSIVAAISTAHDATLDIQPGKTGGLKITVRFPPAPDRPRDAKTDATHDQRSRQSPAIPA
jgi:signal transduction histidine kinase